MNIPWYHIKHEGELEVFKLQKSLFSTLKNGSILIHNENRTFLEEITGKNNVKALNKFFDKNEFKVYVAGYIGKDKKVYLVDKVLDEKYWF